MVTDVYGDYLSRKRIAQVALSVVDKDGLDALTTRRIASEIGVTSPALYHHFGNKADLLDEVVRLALREVREPDRSEPWTVQVLEMASSYRRALVTHPHLVPAMVTHRWRRFASSYMVATARAMAEADVPPALIPVILNCIEMFIYGAALESSATEADQPLPADMPELKEYPEVAEALTRGADHRETFEAGLKAMLAGWEQYLSEP